MLEASAVDDNVEMFQLLVKELETEKLDLSVLIHASKRYPSLLEYCVKNGYLKVAIYLMKHFTFRNKEIISAYSLLTSSLNMSFNYVCFPSFPSSSGKKKDPVQIDRKSVV